MSNIISLFTTCTTKSSMIGYYYSTFEASISYIMQIKNIKEILVNKNILMIMKKYEILKYKKILLIIKNTHNNFKMLLYFVFNYHSNF